MQRSTNGAALDPRIRAREAIAKAMSLRDKVSPRERLYIEAEAARRDAGSRRRRTPAYIAGLRKLVAAYPDDLEAKSILGLALLDGYDSVTKAPRDQHDRRDDAAREGGREGRQPLRRAPLPDSRLGRQHDARERRGAPASAIPSSSRTSRTRSTCRATSTRRATASTTRSPRSPRRPRTS